VQRLLVTPGMSARDKQPRVPKAAFAAPSVVSLSGPLTDTRRIGKTRHPRSRLTGVPLFPSPASERRRGQQGSLGRVRTYRRPIAPSMIHVQDRLS